MSIFRLCAQRDRQPELMDDPQLDPRRHERALSGLARLNKISRSAALVWAPIKQFAKQTSLARIRVLDIATGSGDLPLQIWKRATRSGIQLDITGVDISDCALNVARSRAERVGASIDFQTLDALNDSLPADFDVIMCSTFLHHLSNENAITLLHKMGQATRGLVLVSDLLRGKTNWLLVWLGARLITTSDVVHVDGPRSVKAAFTTREMLQLADEARLNGGTVSRQWPFRFVFQWRRP